MLSECDDNYLFDNLDLLGENEVIDNDNLEDNAIGPMDNVVKHNLQNNQTRKIPETAGINQSKHSVNAKDFDKFQSFTHLNYISPSFL